MITATNYAQHKPDRAQLTEGQQAAYDLIEDGGLEFYSEDATIRETLDLYFTALNKRQPAPASKKGQPLPKNNAQDLKFEAGTEVLLMWQGVKTPGKIQPYLGPGVARIKNGVAEVFLPEFNRSEEIPLAKLTIRYPNARRKASGKTPTGRKGHPLPKKQLTWDERKLQAIHVLGKERVAALLTGKLAYLQGVVREFAKNKAVADTQEAHAYATVLKVREDAGGEMAEWSDVTEKPKALKNATKKASASSKKGANPKTEPKPKAPKKQKPADTRREVPHLENDLVLMRSFLALVEKPVKRVNMKNLHSKLEKAITTKRVRASGEHADLVRQMAEQVAKAYEYMATENIGSIKKLTLNQEVVSRVRAIVEGVKVSAAVGLLGRFINMQGTIPEQKQVDTLLKALHQEASEHPKGDYAVEVGAAAAVLKGWQAGRTVRISTQQLRGLSGLPGGGLGCPDKPGLACDCGGDTWAPKKSDIPAALSGFDNVDYQQEVATDAAPAVAPDGLTELFSQIGQKDKRRAMGEGLPLPGDLGRFVGTIERHEYALALRGEKGAGKSRLLYQLKNLFAGRGLTVASFSLEIDKNSSVVGRYTAAYIAPENRARVQIASEVPKGLDTIRAAAAAFDVVAIDSWGKIPNTQATDFDALRKQFPRTIFLVIFQSTSNGTARGGPSAEYDASAVCQVNLPGIALMEKNRYATGAADELRYDVNAQKLIA